jgi:hypothetical protein
MSPADILAAARQNVVGPYLPARREWLEGRGWIGPVVADTGRAYPWRFEAGERPYSQQVINSIRLDVHRPEVRDHLVRCGCPEWVRDVPAAVWAWGMGVEVVDVITPWNDAADLAALNAGCIVSVYGGWLVPMPGGGVGFFKEVSRDE